MPNYDFTCTKCETAFKKSLPFGSKELPFCPKCGAKTKRIITPPAMIFKGSGFYKNDSRPAQKEAAKPVENQTTKPEPPKASETPAPTKTDPSATK